VIKILYIPPTGPVATREIQPTLESLQGLVGGDIEAIGGTDWTAYLNEEGKLAGLPANPRAGRLADALGWTFLPGDFLVGPVVFCGGVDSNGDETPVTERVLTLALEEIDPR
jgi:hypothetical protein